MEKVYQKEKARCDASPFFFISKANRNKDSSLVRLQPFRPD